MTKYKTFKIDSKIVVALCALIVLILAFAGIAEAAIGTSMRKELWKKGGLSTVSNTDILTTNALAYYAMQGVWGDDCREAVRENRDSISTPDELGTYCAKAKQFYDNAAVYGDIVDARMKEADTQRNFWTKQITGYTTRVDKAMNRFSSLADEVISIMVGFGLLTSVLVFVIIFMKLAWMPSHAMQRRAVMMEIATAGVATMLLGNVWVVVSLFQSIFSRFWQTFAVYSKDWRTVAEFVLVEYKGFIVGLSGIATLLVLAMFVINFVGLALDGGIANKRSEKIQNLLHCAIAAAGLGSITLIVGFFWNMLA